MKFNEIMIPLACRAFWHKICGLFSAEPLRRRHTSSKTCLDLSEETALHLSRSWATLDQESVFNLKLWSQNFRKMCISPSGFQWEILIATDGSACNQNDFIQTEKERVFPFKSRTQLEVTRVKSAWKMAFQFQWIKQVACHNSDEITVKTA